MIEADIFTVVVAHLESPSVVVLAEKDVASRLLGTEKDVASRLFGMTPAAVDSVDARYKRATGSAGTIHLAWKQDDDLVVPQLLPIWIGKSEAEAIMLLLDGQSHTRPQTHDLLANVIGGLGSKVERVVIDKVTGSTFFATVCLNKEGRMVQVDARPSDSIALALLTGARIFIDKDVMNAAAHDVKVKLSDAGDLLCDSDDEMVRFHSFIESISPGDFAP